MVKLAQTENELGACYETMRSLRTEVSRQEFMRLVPEMMQHGYRLAYIEAEKQVVCVAGFRIGLNLALGKHLYVDDLATLETHRSKGHGETMLKWLENYAREQQCRVFHLDSGVQRFRAHKLYFKQDMHIFSYHFAKQLGFEWGRTK
ncbi:MAG: GNAT family N-acetyltransferase [Gammaproteobacteria bacterium]|nr:GNAT family N-acetyltransferase [Gammaproteobacteria bacterium]MDH5802771.1 GNAT family N-acetyltransferase [Gammaproteobacteria bacterium]